MLDRGSTVGAEYRDKEGEFFRFELLVTPLWVRRSYPVLALALSAWAIYLLSAQGYSDAVVRQKWVGVGLLTVGNVMLRVILEVLLSITVNGASATGHREH